MLFHRWSSFSTVITSPLTIAACFGAGAGAGFTAGGGFCCAASGSASAAIDSKSIRFIKFPPDGVQTTRWATGLHQGRIPVGIAPGVLRVVENFEIVSIAISLFHSPWSSSANLDWSPRADLISDRR